MCRALGKASSVLHLKHGGVLMQPDDLLGVGVDQPHGVDVAVAAIAVTQARR